MKTTSYEISKELAEAGFVAKADFFWVELGEDLFRIHLSQSHLVPESVKRIIAYDLETILEALPNVVNDYEELNIKKHEICYYYFDYNSVIYETGVEKQENESLADTAARLLILLHKKGMVNFN